MKKFTTKQLIFILSLFLLSSFNFVSDDYSAISTMEEEAAVSVIRICHLKENDQLGSNNCSAGTWKLDVDTDCNSRITGKIFATNLAAILGAEPIIGNTYSLPSNYPPMHIHSSYDNQSSGPINNHFKYYGDTHVGTDGNTYHLFIYRANIHVDISDQCAIDGQANIGLRVSLVDETGRLYPVNNFAEPHLPFSCKVFAETCSQCISNSCGAVDPLPVYNGTACGSCVYEDCGSDGGSLYSVLGSDKIEGKTKTAVIPSFSISPNPFSENFTIKNLIQEEAEVEIEIFDANGKRVYYSLQKNIDAKQSIEISSFGFANGVYYCKIKTPSNSITKKIIKLK